MKQYSTRKGVDELAERVVQAIAPKAEGLERDCFLQHIRMALMAHGANVWNDGFEAGIEYARNKLISIGDLDEVKSKSPKIQKVIQIVAGMLD